MVGRKSRVDSDAIPTRGRRRGDFRWASGGGNVAGQGTVLWTVADNDGRRGKYQSH